MCSKTILKSDSIKGKMAKTKEKRKNNKIMEGFGLIRCLRNMVFYKNS